MRVFTTEGFTYCPVCKNASTTYMEFFRSKGWREVQISEVPPDNLLFGHIQDPHVRHTKGVAEYLRKYGIEELNPDHSALVVGIFDLHTFPISVVYPKHYDKIHWIPIGKTIKDRQFNSNELTNLFFKKNGLDLIIPVTENKHLSEQSHIDLQEKVDRFKNENIDRYNEVFAYLMMEDLRLYKEAIERQ